tara:strand:- start:50 stop:769 length:720 start_codon:yes stop_codon:yes gene_type:complete
MNAEKNIKFLLGLTYILIIIVFLWFFFKQFSIQDFTSYEIIKKNRDTLNNLKNLNIFLSSLIFFIVTIVWVLLLGFGSPIFLIGGFIFGKWVGTILVVFGLTIGSTLLYYFANFLIKDLIYKKFSSKFKYLTEKFKRNELAYFTLYRAVGGIPFFLQNLLPILFNVKIRNYFFGTIIGLTPQLFVGVSLGAGIDKIIQENEKLPSIWKMLKTPDIYFPLLGIILIFLLAIYFRKKFFKQ